MKTKITISILLLLSYMAFNATIGEFYEISKTPLVGALAVDQLSDSNMAYTKSMWEIGAIKNLSPNFLAFVAVLSALGLLWKNDIKKLFIPISSIAICLAIIPTPANAYYAKTDYTEVVEVLPNQTAFLIPETGANKDGQAAFMSEAYLNANKVAMKRVTIPHVKLAGSGTLVDTYVPGARLLVVDRTPSSREWVSTGDRGTAQKDEGFRFESAESINMETGIVISAFVKEEDAAKFVYWFGAKAMKSDTDEERFASVIYGRSLAEVIDDNVRRKVQSVLAREFGKLPLVEAAKHKADVISITDKEVKDAFAPMGITVSFVGYAEGITYDKEVQTAINGVFLATKETEAKMARSEAIPYEKAMVDINFINAQAEAMKTVAHQWKGDINFPSFFMIPQGLSDTLGGWFGHGKSTPSSQPISTSK